MLAVNINGVYEINNLVKERKAKEKKDEFGERRHGDSVREDMEMQRRHGGARERDKLTKSYRENFRAVATPNREKPKEEE